MDHLPWRHTDRPRPIVPNLCGHLRDVDLCLNSESFHSWPRTQQWKALDWETGIPSVALRCQSWLFLGLAKVVAQTLHLPFRTEHLSSHDDPEILCTRPLTDLFTRLRVPEEHSASITSLLHRAQRQLITYLEHVYQMATTGLACTESEFNVFWSTAILLEILSSHLKANRLMSSHATKIAQLLNTSNHIADRIRLTGRCPTILRRKTLTPIDTWTLLATPLQDSNFEVDQTLSHTTCTGRNCHAFNIDKDTYKTQHTSYCGSDQHCVLREINVEALKAKINGGRIPIVRSVVDKRGLIIDLVDDTEIDDFTAISHVWAGGLGNFTKNALYECQLQSLHYALSPFKILRSTVYYWLDTLCVPVTDDHLRRIAIDDMARIYASATNVYVLDPTMLHTNVAQLKFREQAVLIAASPWMARSWTFQEAALAVQLQFRFHDSVVNFSEVDLPNGPLNSSQLQLLWRRDVDRSEGGNLFDFASLKYYLSNAYVLLVRHDSIPSYFRFGRLAHHLSRGSKAPEQSTPADHLTLVWKELAQRGSKELQDVAAIIAVFMGRTGFRSHARPMESCSTQLQCAQ